jgi:hypothetical protein
MSSFTEIPQVLYDRLEPCLTERNIIFHTVDCTPSFFTEPLIHISFPRLTKEDREYINQCIDHIREEKEQEVPYLYEEMKKEKERVAKER